MPLRLQRVVPVLAPILLALALLSAAAEAVTRFANRNAGIYDVEMYRYSRLLKEDAPPEAPAMHHWHRKNAEAVLQRVLIRTNALRMRDRPRAETPAPGTTRILVLGDSITLGWGVAQDRTYSAVLESRLTQEAGPGRFEVLNAGVGNYTLSRMIGYYDFALRRLDPEIVIVAFYLTNASREQESSLARLLDTPLQFPVFLWSRSLRAYARLSRAASFRDHYLDLYRDGRGEYEEFKKQLADFIVRLRADGRDVLFLNVPDVRYAAEKPYPFAGITDRVFTVASGSGAHVLDLTPSVNDLSPETAVNSVEDRHPAAAAHERFADAIFGGLKGAGLLPARAPGDNP